MSNNRFSLFVLGLFSFTLMLVASSASVYAASTGVAQATDNIVASTSQLPGLVTALCYLMGLLFGVTGVLKLKDHVDSRASSSTSPVPLRTPIIRFLTGGAFFALPMIFEAAARAFGVPLVGFGLAPLVNNFTVGLSGLVGSTGGSGINSLLRNMTTSLSTVPNLISTVGYLLGLLACVAGVLKIKEHVESPERVELKEGVIRLLIGGALLSLPRIYQATFANLTATNGVTSVPVATVIGSIAPDVSRYLHSTFSDNSFQTCGLVVGEDSDGLGAAICRFVESSGATPAFLMALCYLFGIVIGIWALLKIRDHVLNPQQTSIWEGVSRLIVTGAFLAMPYIAGIIQTSLTGGDAFTTTDQHGGYHAITCTATDRGLDTAMACFMRDVMAPAHILIGHFAFLAGLVFIMIGITRIMKSAQEGARGPGGKGTLVTFLIAGVLLSYNIILEFFTSSLSLTGQTDTLATLTYTTGMTPDEVEHAQIVVQTILQFMIIVGLISFVRGWFIIRDVAEGGQQASLMAGVTHILGGALAINLGPLLNAVQSTLGIAGVGIGFS